MRRLAILVVLAVVGSSCSGAEEVAPLVSPEHVRAVQVGMTQEEVVSILGEPDEKLQEDWQRKASLETWKYKPAVWFAYQYPVVSVFFGSSRVSGVVVKNWVQWGFDWHPVYWKPSDTGDAAQESPDFESIF